MQHSRGRRARRYRTLQGSLTDARSGEVVFLSHCLLNQNTRYLGGAGCRGVVDAAIAGYLRDGTGIVQLPCPEQRVWGGVLKTRMLWLVQHPRIARILPPLLPALRGYLRWRYARIARAVTADLADYLASGLTVRGIVGVAGSPSCGLRTTLDLEHAVRGLARRPDVATAEWLNTAVIEPAIRPGSGLFLRQLAVACARRHLRVPLLEEAVATGTS